MGIVNTSRERWARSRGRNLLLRKILRVALRPRSTGRLVRLGSKYGGWIVPESTVRPGAVCYLAGLGEDATFDLALIAAGCTVLSIDPTPRSVSYAERLSASEPRFRLLPVGLWSENTKLRFYAPRDPSHVSHSIVNLQGTDTFFEAECRTVLEVMAEHQHPRLDLLKLDIEGAEFAVLESLERDNVSCAVIAVEFDQPTSLRGILRAVARVRRRGYRVIAVDGWNVTLLSNSG
jgi:FkbM family methyltransferase